MARTAKIASYLAPLTVLAEGDPTVRFYEAEAGAYFRSTVRSDLAPLWDRFLATVRPGGRILDAGSGSGRDTRLFLDRGYCVDAFDASPALAALSSRHTGQRTQIATFQDWVAPPAQYDGVWAFASLLHVRRPQLAGVIEGLARSLKPGGPLFASFKGGPADTIDSRGRRFTNLTSSTAAALFRGLPEFDAVEVWTEEAPAAHGEVATWVYVLARRAALGEAQCAKP